MMILPFSGFNVTEWVLGIAISIDYLVKATICIRRSNKNLQLQHLLNNILNGAKSLSTIEKKNFILINLNI